MERLTESILQRVTTLPEGAPVSAKMLLHLGTRPAVDQSLSRLARRGQLLRAGRGMYVSPDAYGSTPSSRGKPRGNAKRLPRLA